MSKNHINRRDSLKILGAGSLAGLTWACGPEEAAEEHAHQHTTSDSMELSEADQKLMDQQFFTDHEMKTVSVLSDLIIPADDRSGSATDAGVPEFIEFMMKDQPWHQTGMRGGLRWLDYTCQNQFEKSFVDCSESEQTQILDQIAYPASAAPEMSQGVNFFNNFRDFVATGFFTSKMGIDDLGYVGNRPNVWQGSPPEVLEALGVSYDMVKEYTFVN
uniref:Gluconate 2-dehydrogenase subunit 3 family protein n=1 Tax=Roseihalotalea indica TaxID=2867963 RepID=A0AA49GSA7_9BACT|nr:gluconate 2-dehydrogenase subunit 3 family protein [Tunicatimonas sp. TK19036]